MSVRFTLILLFLLQLAAAQTQEMTLADGARHVLEHDPGVRRARLEAEKTRYQLQALAARALPRVDLDADLRYHFARPVELAPGELFEAPGRDLPIRFGKPILGAAGLTLRQPLYDRAMTAGREGRGKLIEVNEKRQRKAAEDAVLEMAKTYMQALIVDEKRGLLEANIRQVEGLLTLVERQRQNGFAREIDVKRLRVARQNLEVKQRNLALQYDQLLQLLKYRLAMPLDAPLTLRDTLSDASPYALPEADADSAAVAGRTELALLRLRNELTQIQADRLRAGGAPRLSLLGALRLSAWGDTPAEWARTDYWYGDSFIGLRLDYPLYDGGERRNQVALTLLEAEQGRLELQQAEQGLHLQLAAARQRLTVQYNELQALRDTRDLAEEVYQLTLRQYAEGLAPVMDLLSTATARDEAQTNYLTALLEAKLAELEWRAARGELIEWVTK